MVGALVPQAAGLAVGSVGEADSTLERGGKLLAARLTADEFLLLTPTGVAPAAMDAMLKHDASCAHVVDITSGLSGVSIIGPASPRLLNAITELDVSPRAMPDLACAQARFRRDTRHPAAPRRPRHPHFPTLHRPRIRRIPVGSHSHRRETRRRRPRRHRSALGPESYELNTERTEATEEKALGEREELNGISGQIIGSAIEVHRALGPGLLESAYEACLAHELFQRGLAVERQKHLPITYKTVELDAAYRLDLLVERRVVVELKAVEQVYPIHKTQLLTYLKLSGLKLGLLINFNVKVLKDGIDRVIYDKK